LPRTLAELAHFETLFFFAGILSAAISFLETRGYICMYVCMYVYMYICKNLECNTNETNVSRYEDTESFSQFYSGFLKRLVLAYFHILSSGKQLGCIRRQKI
jgi:Ca2+/Na+ antiporter